MRRESWHIAVLLITLSQTSQGGITKNSRWSHLRTASTMRAIAQCASFSYFDFPHSKKVIPLVLMFQWTTARWTATGRVAQPWMTATAAQIKKGREDSNKSALAR